jgi:hypothetical protein
LHHGACVNKTQYPVFCQLPVSKYLYNVWHN